MNSRLLYLLLLFCWSNASQVENHQTFNTTTSSDTDASTTTAGLHLIDHSTTASFGEPQSIANETTSSSPVPQFDCLQRGDGFYANPSEPCSELYFACVAGSPIPELCPPPLVFEEAPSQSCVWREQLLACLPPHLRHITQPETSSTPATTTAIRAEDEGPIFQYECNDTAGNFPDPQRNCSSIFYVCPPSFKFGIRMHCPQSLFFDHQMNWCDSFERIPECSGAPRIVEEQTTPAPQFAPMVHFDCSEKRDGNYPVPDLACPRWFIQCTNGNAFRANCPGNQRYFVDADRCLAPNAVPSCLDPKAVDSSSTSTIIVSEHSTTSMSAVEEHPATVETTLETTSTTAAETTLPSADLQSSSTPFESSSISTPFDESTTFSFPALTSTTSEVQLAESSTVVGEVERMPAPAANNNGFIGNDVIRPSTTTTEAIGERQTMAGGHFNNSSAADGTASFTEVPTTPVSSPNEEGLSANNGVSTRATGGFNSASQMVHFDCSEKRDGNYPVPDLACPRWFIQCTNGNAFRANCPGNQRYFVDADRCLAPNAVPSCLDPKAVDSSSTSTITGSDLSTASLSELAEHSTTVETTAETTSTAATETTLPSADLQSSSIPFESSSISTPFEESTTSSFPEFTSTPSEVVLAESSPTAGEVETTPAPSANHGFIGNGVIRPSTTTMEAIVERETVSGSHFDNSSAVNDTTAFPVEPTTAVSSLNEEGLSGNSGASNQAIGGSNSTSQTLSQSEATTVFFEQTTSASEVIGAESSVGALNSTIAIHQGESTVAPIGLTTTVSEISGAESSTASFPGELTTTETTIQNDEGLVGNRSSSSVGEFVSTIAKGHRSETTAAFIERTTATAGQTTSTAFPETSTAETIIQSDEGLIGNSGTVESTGDEFNHGQKATTSGLAKPTRAVGQIGNFTSENTTAIPATSTDETIIQSEEGPIGNSGALKSMGDEFSHDQKATASGFAKPITAVSQLGNVTAENTTAFPEASTSETIVQSEEGLNGNSGALTSTDHELNHGQKATTPELARLTTAVVQIGNVSAENTTAFPATSAAEAKLTAIIVHDSNFTALLIPHQNGVATNNSVSAVTIEKFNSTIVVHQHEVRNVSAESTTVVPEPQRTTEEANLTESALEDTEAEGGLFSGGSNRSSGEFNSTILRHNLTTIAHSIQFNTTTATPTTPTPSLFELFDRFGAQAVRALGGRKNVEEAPQPLEQQITTEAVPRSDHVTTIQPISAQHSTANVTNNSSSLVADEEPVSRNETIADNARTSTIVEGVSNKSTLPPFLATSESTAENQVSEPTPHSADLSADGERLGVGHSADRTVEAQTDTTAELSDGRSTTQQQHNATTAPDQFENNNATTISAAIGTPIGEEPSTPIIPNSQNVTVA